MVIDIYGDGGSSSGCGSSREWQVDDILCQNYQIKKTGQIISLYAWIHNNPGNMKGGVWDNDTSVPGNLLGVTDIVGIPDLDDISAFIELPLVSPVNVVENDIIWIGFVTDIDIESCNAGASPNDSGLFASATPRQIKSHTFADPLPDPFGASSSYSSARPIQYGVDEPVIPSNQGAAPIVVIIA